MEVDVFNMEGQKVSTVELPSNIFEAPIKVDLMHQATGESPILLLDDVMSELDATRRARVMSMVDGVEQAFLTTTDWSDFTEAFRAQAHLLQVEAGRIEIA